MNAFTGTWRLVRLALRRDRIKLPVILLALFFMFYASANAAVDFYGKTLEDQVNYAATNASSVVARLFNGPIGGPHLGAIVLNETYLITALAIAFVSTMTIVRHTRQNEESGRSELIESGIVSRHASLTAAMIVTTLLNVFFAAMVYVSLITIGLPSAGAFGTAAGLAATGIVFAALAAVAVQLADSARGANNFSAIAIGVAFLLRAVGDGIGSVTQNGLAVASAFPSWLSPLAWGQLIFPFTDKQWWVFGLYFVTFAVALGTAIVLMSKRDIGMGMITTKPGRAAALNNLLSPFGLTRRLQRGTLRGWAIAVTILGASFGLVIKDFENFMAENEQFREALSQSGVHGSFRDIFLSLIIGMMAIIIAGYAIQSLLRLRSEESNGQAESILSAAVSRTKWQFSHIGYVAVGILVLTCLSGLSIGVSYIASTGSSWGELWPIVSAALTNSTAIFTLLGLIAATIVFFPRSSIAIAWTAFAGCLLILQFGALLRLPQAIINLSPFGHLPAMPAENFEIIPVFWLSVASLGMLGAALVYFRRRDIVLS